MVKNEPIIDIEYEENLMLDVEPNISTKCTAVVVDGADNQHLAGEGSSTDDADEGNGDLDEGDVFEIDDQSESEDETVSTPNITMSYLKRSENSNRIMLVYRYI